MVGRESEPDWHCRARQDSGLEMEERGIFRHARYRRQVVATEVGSEGVKPGTEE